MQYLKRESGADGIPVLKIEDFQVPLPSDIQVLDGVAFSTTPNGPWIPMSTMTRIFKEPTKHVYDACEDHFHQPMRYKLPTS